MMRLSWGGPTSHRHGEQPIACHLCNGRGHRDPPATAAGTYPAVAAAFGTPPDQQGQAGNIVLVSDGSANPSHGCNPLTGFPAGAIALIDRGTCPFTQNVHNAQDAGAVAAIVVNNEPGDAFQMGGTDLIITIPSVLVSIDDGNAIKAGLPATGSVARVLSGP